MSDDPSDRGQDFNDMLGSSEPGRIASIIDSALGAAGVAAADSPHPRIERGSPQGGGAGDDDGVSDADAAIPDDAATISAEIIAACALQPPNDTGNGQRLLAYFRDDVLFIDKIGWHCWDGARWKGERGDHVAALRAQQTAARIVLEADYMAATPGEMAAIEAGEDAKVALDRLRKEVNGKDATAEQKATARRLEEAIETGEWAAGELKKRKIARRKYAITSGNSGKIAGMLDQAKPHRNRRPDELDLDPLKFNVGNGTLHFLFDEVPDPDAGEHDDGKTVKRWRVELLPHNRDDYISRVADVDYDPKAECPLFEAQIGRFQPIEGVREFLRRYYGYSLTGLVGAQCLVFNWGEGSNWKSTYTEIISRVMGDYAHKIDYISIAGDGQKTGSAATPDLAELPGARLVRTGEIKRNTILNEALIKDMTSGEPMTARANFKDPFRFRPTFKLAMTGNHKPEIGGVDHGIWRRIHFVPWRVMIEKSQMRNMEDVLAELLAERSGILNWLIKGAIDFLNDGLRPPQEVLEATETYREESDPVGSFVADCVTRMPPPPHGEAVVHFVSAREMYDSYVAYCLQNGLRAFKEKGFGSALSQKGFDRDRLKTLRRYVNVELHDVPAMPRRSMNEPPPAEESDYVP
jgi:putative DNA primase/helicase